MAFHPTPPYLYDDPDTTAFEYGWLASGIRIVTFWKAGNLAMAPNDWFALLPAPFRENV